MIDQTAQRGIVELRKPFHRAASIATSAVTERKAKLTLLHLAIDGEPRPHRRVSSAHRTGRFRRHPVRCLDTEIRIEAAEIIEDDARARRPGQRVTMLRRAEIAQHAIAETMIGYGPQDLLDALDQRAVSFGAAAETDRESAREPAHDPCH